MTGERYDVVVAGAGHNSLITAAYLACAGYSVGIVEAMDEVGGNCRSEELFPGYFFDTCASAHSQIQSNPLISRDELGLSRYGLEYIYPDPKAINVFAGGDSIAFHTDVEQTVEQISAYSVADGIAYRALIADIDALGPVFGRDQTTPGGVLTRPEGMGSARAARFLGMSAFDVVVARFEHPLVQASLLQKSALTIYPPHYPGSCRTLLTSVRGNHRGAWATPRGGAGELTQSLRRLLEAHGAEFHCGRRVSSLILQGGRCAGVETSDGERLYADRAVVSTIHIKHLVEMAPETAWNEDFVAGVEDYLAGFTLFAQYLAVTEPPRFVCRDGERQAIAGELAFSTDDLVHSSGDHTLGRFNPRAWLIVHTGSVVDEERAPDGHHTVKIVGPQPYRLAGGGPALWDELGQEYADQVLEQVRTVAPNLTDDRIVHRAVKTPLDLERMNLHNVGGSCHGGSAFPSQSGHLRPVPGWSEHRMPIEGLYQTGSTTHPGGSISGHPGRNAARVILQDLGTSLEAVTLAVA